MPPTAHASGALPATARLPARRSAARTHVGKVRSLNEDSLLDRAERGIWAVADGLGGHDRGDVASGLLIEALDAAPPVSDLDIAVGDAIDRIVAVDIALRREAGRRGCGSTIVVLVLAGDRFACLWAGDSRLWRLRDGRLERLSRDHSHVEELVEAGIIAPEAAFGHPFANRITRAVGVGDSVAVEVVRGAARRGDRFLLSSDGLHAVVPAAAIAALAHAQPLDAAVDQLVDAALDAGGPDNISVVMVEVSP